MRISSPGREAKLKASLAEVVMKIPHEPDKTSRRGRRDFLKVGGVSIAANLAYTALPPAHTLNPPIRPPFRPLRRCRK